MPSRLLVLSNGHGRTRSPCADPGPTAAPADLQCWFCRWWEEGSAFKAAEAGGELKTHAEPRLGCPAAIQQARAFAGCWVISERPAPAELAASYRFLAAAGGVAARPWLAVGDLRASAAGLSPAVRPTASSAPRRATTPGASGLPQTGLPTAIPRKEANGTHWECGPDGPASLPRLGCQGTELTARWASAPWRAGLWHRQIQ